VSKAGEKLVPDANDLVGLLALSGNLARHLNVAAVPVSLPVGIARQGSGSESLPGHHSAGVQTAGERYPDALPASQVAGQGAGKGLPKLLVILLYLERRLLLPIRRVKVPAFAFQSARPEGPGRPRRQQLNAVEQGAVFEHASAADELSQRARVRPPEFGANRQDGLGFDGKIEGVFCLVNIDAVHPVAVVEQGRDAPKLVRHQSLKAPVEGFEKAGILLIEVHQIGRPFSGELVTLFPEGANLVRVGIFFPGERQNDVALFVAQRHEVRKGVLACGPADIHAPRLVHPCPRRVERLVPDGLNHPQKLPFRARARHLADKADDSRHRSV
jgi:hypothetical protein